jgi:hypothetical protein
MPLKMLMAKMKALRFLVLEQKKKIVKGIVSKLTIILGVSKMWQIEI